MKELIAIQQELVAKKDQRNGFGKYNYRSAEGILQAAKPSLKTHKCLLTLSDELVLIGERYYIKATAKIVNEEGKEESSSSYAREQLTKKGCDESQVTGGASSYARKYALSGLLLVDDSDGDPDSKSEDDNQPKPPPKDVLTNKHENWPRVVSYYKKENGSNVALEDIKGKYTLSKREEKELKEAIK